MVVGVNRFRDDDAPHADLSKADPKLEGEQVARLRELRSRRDAGRATERLDALQQAAAGAENLMPFILGAVEAEVTLGEIAHALRAVFGVYRERPVL